MYVHPSNNRKKPTMRLRRWSVEIQYVLMVKKILYKYCFLSGILSDFFTVFFTIKGLFLSRYIITYMQHISHNRNCAHLSIPYLTSSYSNRKWRVSRLYTKALYSNLINQPPVPSRHSTTSVNYVGLRHVWQLKYKFLWILMYKTYREKQTISRSKKNWSFYWTGSTIECYLNTHCAQRFKNTGLDIEMIGVVFMCRFTVAVSESLNENVSISVSGELPRMVLSLRTSVQR